MMMISLWLLVLIINYMAVNSQLIDNNLILLIEINTIFQSISQLTKLYYGKLIFMVYSVR